MEEQIKLVHEACNKLNNDIPRINPGDIVAVHLRIKEQNKERIQQFQGNVIQIKGHKDGIRRITVLRVAYGVTIECIFPIPSPNILKIEVKRQAKVRRARLNYLRNMPGGKKLKLKYKV